MKSASFLLLSLVLVISCKKEVSNGGNTTATITALLCSNAAFTATATAGTAYAASGTVPYNGGNGISFTTGTAVNSTGVTGLTATLQAGILASGSGSLTYAISGTPSAAGSASFDISFGGQSCTFNLTVNTAGATTPLITALTCASVSYSATSTVGVAYNATATVPYTGGNGIVYPVGTAISSTGVTGLTATLTAGTLASGAGNLTYTITGTPATAGTANFAISFGTQSCSLALTVNTTTPPSPTITALTCASVSYSATATAGSAYTATATVPYSGGNGVAYSAGTAISSTGVTGLTATLTAGTLASGSGNLSYTVTGTPATAGTAVFALTFGGQSCSISLTVNSAGCTVPTVFTNNFLLSAVTITATCTSVTLKSDGRPNHVSPYWPTTSSLYEAQIAGQTTNPGNIGVQNFTMVIPVNPVAATTQEATSLGPIGMALNGVAIYNDREGGNVPVDANTLLTFDRAGAHNGPGNLYHYHFTGDFTGNDNANLIGYLRDGFPIYARKDNDGTYPSNLDANGGHVGVTAQYPGGIYHYHAANTAYMGSRFYVLKAGSYHGTKGTFTF